MVSYFSDRFRLVVAALVVAVVAAGCGAATASIHSATGEGSLVYMDPQGWSLRYPSSLSLERSTSGPGLATFTEVTVANFAQRRAVVTGKTRDGGFILVRPPLDGEGRFPADGVAFRMLLVDGGPPPIGTFADSRFPVELSTFARPQYGDFSPRDYAALGVPHELTRPIDANGQHYQALVLIGAAASRGDRAAIERVVASITFPRLRAGEQAGDESVVGLASRYPVGSFTLVHAPGELCDGSVYRCHAGRQPFYLVHAPGRLHQPDLIQPCEPAPAACTPPGAFYALGWTSEDVLGGYRSACDLRFDRADERFYCTNSPARWDRTGRAIRVPHGARFADGLQFAFAKVAWDGHVVFLPGLGGNPPRARARALLWPDQRDLTRVPATRGEDLAGAYVKLHAAGLAVSFRRRFSLDWSQECMPLVRRSSPSAGAEVNRGSAVLLVERTPGCAVATPAAGGTLPSYRVPSFIGKPLPAAIAWVHHHDLYWAATIPPLRAGRAASLYGNYTITAQRPTPGATIRLGLTGPDSFQPTPLTLVVTS